MKRAMREEVTKSVRDEFCVTLQHRSEAMRKDHEWQTREALEFMRYRVRKLDSERTDSKRKDS